MLMRKDESFELKLRSAEVDEQAALMAGSLEVVDHLGIVSRVESGERFQFDNDRPETDKGVTRIPLMLAG